MKFNFLTLLCAIALLLSTQSCRHNYVDGDTGTIKGLVVDTYGQVVSGVSIASSPSTGTTTTGTTGEFVLNSVSSGSYTITASKSGYASASATVTVTSGKTVGCTLVLGDNNGSGSGENMALKFNGGDGGRGAYVQVPHSTDLNLNGHSYTIEAWFNPATILAHSVWGQWILNKGVNNDNNEYLLGMDQSGRMTFWSSYTGTIWSRTSLSTSSWAHVAIVVNEETKKATLYINGDADGQVSFYGSTPVSTTTPLFLGARNYFGQNFGVETWDGIIDEIRIWNVARTQSEINAKMHKVLSGDESGLLAYWKFNETSGATVSDATGHGHTGALVNDVRRVVSTAPIE